MSLIVYVSVPEGIAISSDTRRVDEYVAPDNGITDGQTLTRVNDSFPKLTVIHDRFAVCLLGYLAGGLTTMARLTAFARTPESQSEHIVHFAKALLAFLRGQEVGNALAFVAGAAPDGRHVVARVSPRHNKMAFDNRTPGSSLDAPERFDVFSSGSNDVAKRIMAGATMNFPSMSLQTAVDLSRFLVHSSCEYERFVLRPEPIGGFVETAIVTPKGARMLAELPVVANATGAPAVAVE